MDESELDLLRRSLGHAVEQNTGAPLDRALEHLGWQEALVVDPCPSISIFFELQGGANSVSSALDQVLLAGAREVPRTTGVVLPALGSWHPPGLLKEDTLVVSGLWAGGAGDRSQAIVFVHDGDRSLTVTVQLAALTVRPIDGMDPQLGLCAVSGTIAGVEARGADWPSALALGQLAVAHELVGASRRMLELAREHALNRIQFGQPIGRFQAVRHRLADTLVAIETADAMLDAAWLDRRHESAAIAKAVAGRGARLAGRHCQQVLAGIGFTAEHPFHRYLRRVLVLDGILGSSRLLTVEFGRRLLETRQLPSLLPL